MKMSRVAMMMGAVAMMSQVAEARTEFDDRWYIAPSAGLVFPDGDRETRDDLDYHYGLSVGRFFSPNFSLDLRLDRYRLGFAEQTPGAGESIQLHSYGVFGRYFFREGQATRPYLLAGTGIQGHDSAYHDGRDIFGSLGVGVEHTYSDRVSFRMEVEGRYDNDRDTFNRSSGFFDVLVTAGLRFPLGARPEPVVAEPPPAPPPPPPPPPAPEPDPEPEVILEFDAAVFFEFDSATLRPAAIAELNEAAALLNLHDELTRVEVAGHTCDLGSASYNQGLSERRARAVRDHLVEQGEVSADRLVVRGYGEDRPKVPNTSTENRQQNRRVELIVLERRND